MEHLDRLFDTVLAAAKARGSSIETDTLVCFFSDHGEMLDDHDDIDKSKPWQGSLNVPLVCAGPGVARNATVLAPVATLDIGATVLDFAGALAWRDPHASARSFRGLLEGRHPRTRNRTHVHSGLQSYDFSETPPPAAPRRISPSAAAQASAAQASAAPMVEERRTPTVAPTVAPAGGGARDDPRDDERPPPPAEPPFSFRLVVAELDAPPTSTYKLICCKGACPGAPSTAPPPDADGYTRLLYDTLADPFDLRDLKRVLPHVAEELRAALPVAHGFNCSAL